jgi:hypothetical protein
MSSKGSKYSRHAESPPMEIEMVNCVRNSAMITSEGRSRKRPNFSLQFVVVHALAESTYGGRAPTSRGA